MRQNTTIAVAVALVALLGAATSAQAQAVPGFTCVASAGAVDESGQAIFKADGPAITLRDDGPALKRLVVRYAIAPMDSLALPEIAGPLEMAALIRDPGEGSFVKLWLMEVDLRTGETTPKLSLNSDRAEASAELQEIAASECDQVIAGQAFDFERYAYYIHAVLGQHAGGEAPTLHNVQLRWQSSCP